ncbi:methyltransferase [Streptomyces sp. NPDC001380]|uniref:methyltransferase n=1 Tax=Streptomyces sp. NPDC001380 TaxID=3364566 RepID=UPI003678EDF7
MESTAAVAPAAPSAAMRLRELAFSAASAAAVRAAVRLGLPDALGDNPVTAGELAAAVDADPQALRRLMRALTCQGVFAEDGEGRFVHTAMSRMLREDTPRSMRYVSLWTTEPWTWDAWQHLDEAVRRGGHVFHELYGKEFFTYLHEDAPESAEVFNKAMTHSSRQSAQDIAEMLDLRGVSLVADIGGGQGHVLAGLLERNPDLRGALLDLPGVVANADPRLRDGGALADRVELVPGDCRQAIPVQADLYIIKNILEWDDRSTRATLRNTVAAARPGARVLVIENLVDETASMPFTAAMDLLLLLNVGGRKHTQDGLVALMEEAGLKVGDVRPVNPYLHAFDAVVPE